MPVHKQFATEFDKSVDQLQEDEERVISKVRERYARRFLLVARESLKPFNLKRHKLHIGSGMGGSYLMVVEKAPRERTVHAPNKDQYRKNDYFEKRASRHRTALVKVLNAIADFFDRDDAWNWTMFLDQEALN